MKLIKPMKLTDVGSTDEIVEVYINNPEFIMQQKFDGTHAMFFFDVETGEVSWGNGTHSAAKLKHGALEEILVPALTPWAERNGMKKGTVALDGELLIRTGEFLVWDILVEEEGQHVPERAPYGSLEYRLGVLEDFFDVHIFELDQELVKHTPTAWYTDDKRDMWEIIKSTNVEGAISKRIISNYVPEVRSRDWLKHKLVKTADLVVVTASRKFKENKPTVVERGAAGLAYVGEDGELKSICSSSLIGKDLTIEPGDVVEVAYLYRETGGGGLVQPRILRKRWDAATQDGDKRPEECTEDQFPEYSRSVVFF